MRHQTALILLSSLITATAFAAEPAPALMPASPEDGVPRRGLSPATETRRLWQTAPRGTPAATWRTAWARPSGYKPSADLQEHCQSRHHYADHGGRECVAGPGRLRVERHAGLGGRFAPPAPAGMFYGVQTLLQLLPPEAFAATPAAGMDWKIPCVQIEDQPRFKWRGLMLDVARHFFTKAEVKQLLDELATQKINTFHLHLDRRPGLAYRDQEVSAPHAGRRLAGRGRIRPGPEASARPIARTGSMAGITRRRTSASSWPTRLRGISPSCRRLRCPGTRARHWRLIPS